jgi:hypothetical protein
MGSIHNVSQIFFLADRPGLLLIEYGSGTVSADTTTIPDILVVTFEAWLRDLATKSSADPRLKDLSAQVIDRVSLRG